MKPNKLRPISRVSPAALNLHQAKFTLGGLRFHFAKLHEYTCRTGGGLDKIPLNTLAYEQLHRSQYTEWPEVIRNPLDESYIPEPSVKPKPIFLRKKTQYQVANHLLGIGKVAYWTGSRGPSTLLGLDIDDHGCDDPDRIVVHSIEALALFTEMTSLKPITCPSSRGIHGFLIYHKNGFSTLATNETWHGIVRLVEEERCRRGLCAKLECKGKAKIVNDKTQYGGVLLKDPFTGQNPTDDDLRAFWEHLEANAIIGSELLDLRRTLDANAHESTISHRQEVSSGHQSRSADVISKEFSGKWAKRCREWAIHGLPGEDSIAEVVGELATWLYFVEFWEIEESGRYEDVVGVLQEFCQLKHNGFVTRLTEGKIDDVKDHVRRIVHSSIRMSSAGQAVFEQLRNKRSSGKYVDTWYLAPMMTSLSFSPSSSVKLTICCSVSNEEERTKNERPDPKDWVFVPDLTPLPVELDESIKGLVKDRKGKKKTYLMLVAFLNHLKCKNGEAHLGVQSLKKMGFSNHAARTYLEDIRKMGIIRMKGYSPVAGLGKLFVLTPKARELMEMAAPEDAYSFLPNLYLRYKRGRKEKKEQTSSD